ncbi:hypothetical protein B296_00052160 [Ensete ventricosum]|uniref:Uncharacterized protein n=1 Tax=Ensete ventricosum TaxID=4639 RepID=A0A426YDH8_ENSVE|nr:hypothetical protein B296_00052160 [Ensete ventricosum]
MTTRITPGVGANLLGQHSAERNQEATTYVGNLDPQVLLFAFSLLFFPIFSCGSCSLNLGFLKKPSPFCFSLISMN